MAAKRLPGGHQPFPMMSISNDGGETWFKSPEDEPAERPVTPADRPQDAATDEPQPVEIVGVPRQHELPWRPLRTPGTDGPTNGQRTAAIVVEPPAPPPAPPPVLPPIPTAAELVAPPRRHKRRRLLVAGLLIAVLIGGGLAAGLLISGARRGSTTPAKPAAKPTLPLLNLLGGMVASDDDFSNSLSGWPTGSLDSGGTAAYKVQGYTLTVSGTTKIHRAASPYPYALQAMSATVQVDRMPVTPGTGVGVECQQQVKNGTRYAFVLYGDGTWSVVSYPNDNDEWGVESSRGNAYNLIRQNQTNAISGACINVAGPGGVVEAHVAMAVNGTTVTDFTDSLYTNGLGWTPAVVAVSGSAQPYDASFRDFTIRDLGGPKPSL